MPTLPVSSVSLLPPLNCSKSRHISYLLSTVQAHTNEIPHTEMLYQPDYRAQQLDTYWKNRTGPFTIAKDGGNVVAFLSLPTINPDWLRIVEMAKSQVLSTVYPAETDSTVLAGYSAQRSIVQRLLSGKTAPVIEIGWNTNSIMPITLTKPFSRGTVNIQSTSIYKQPAIDFGVLSDPTDLEMLIAIVNITRTLIQTPAMQELRPVENIPGAKFIEKKTLQEAIKENLNPTYVHPCCTASMMKRELGGVVDKGLLVYGVKGLSIVDASVFPLIPGTHPSATLYALSEKVSWSNPVILIGANNDLGCGCDKREA
jgi:choline dehydrogenase-like flavoprotein